jgi:hypothetical protein
MAALITTDTQRRVVCAPTAAVDPTLAQMATVSASNMSTAPIPCIVVVARGFTSSKNGKSMVHLTVALTEGADFTSTNDAVVVRNGELRARCPAACVSDATALQWRQGKLTDADIGPQNIVTRTFPQQELVSLVCFSGGNDPIRPFSSALLYRVSAQHRAAISGGVPVLSLSCGEFKALGTVSWNTLLSHPTVLTNDGGLLGLMRAGPQCIGFPAVLPLSRVEGASVFNRKDGDTTIPQCHLKLPLMLMATTEAGAPLRELVSVTGWDDLVYGAFQVADPRVWAPLRALLFEHPAFTCIIASELSMSNPVADSTSVFSDMDAGVASPLPFAADGQNRTARGLMVNWQSVVTRAFPISDVMARGLLGVSVGASDPPLDNYSANDFMTARSGYAKLPISPAGASGQHCPVGRINSAAVYATSCRGSLLSVLAAFPADAFERACFMLPCSKGMLAVSEPAKVAALALGGKVDIEGNVSIATDAILPAFASTPALGPVTTAVLQFLPPPGDTFAYIMVVVTPRKPAASAGAHKRLAAAVEPDAHSESASAGSAVSTPPSSPPGVPTRPTKASKPSASPGAAASP